MAVCCIVSTLQPLSGRLFRLPFSVLTASFSQSGLINMSNNLNSHTFKLMADVGSYLCMQFGTLFSGFHSNNAAIALFHG